MFGTNICGHGIAGIAPGATQLKINWNVSCVYIHIHIYL